MRALRRALFGVFIGTTLGLTYGIHAEANAAYVPATWDRDVVTINDESMAHLAVEWEAPFRIAYADKGADITVEIVDGLAKSERILGDATPEVDDETIVSCHIRLDADAQVPVYLHELGHCLGLMGHTEPGTLMSTFGDTPVVTDADRANLARLYQ